MSDVQKRQVDYQQAPVTAQAVPVLERSPLEIALENYMLAVEQERQQKEANEARYQIYGLPLP